MGTSIQEASPFNAPIFRLTFDRSEAAIQAMARKGQPGSLSVMH